MYTLLLAMAVITVAEVAFLLALPRLLALRGIEATRRGLLGLTMVFETPDQDGTPVRVLNVNGVFQSASYVSDELWSELVCVYHRQMVDQINELGPVRTVLVIGGGGYSLPKFLITHSKRLRVCVVEIDPTMTELARTRFFLDRVEQHAEGRLELVCADGWQWLRQTDRRFDVIVNDAFSAGKPLQGFMRPEGARLVRQHLSPQGVYLANLRYPLEGRGARRMHDIERAYAEEFGTVRIIAENPDEPRRLGDNVLVATNQGAGHASCRPVTATA